MEIFCYDELLSLKWDAFVKSSRNGTFLHQRRFMDYHAARFQDRSVIAKDEKGDWLAVLPANCEGDAIVSHAGLTYAGLLMSRRLTQEKCMAVFNAIAAHFRSQGIKRIIYKPTPHIFHAFPAEDDLYALFRVGARLIRRDASTAISLRDTYTYTKGRKWSVNKGRKAGLMVGRQGDPSGFHLLLSQVLQRHQATPVHSLNELLLLMERFPDQIILHEASLAGRLQAAALVFDFGNTVHTQYLAASDEGRENGALDFLIASLLEGNYAERRFFSFGTSTEQAGMILNEGLIAQKEGFGGRTVVHDFYEWTL